MRFLVDAQLPPELAHFLDRKGYEARAVRDVGLREATDRAIWDFAISDDWVVVTKDEDFAERALQAKVGPKILWLRIGNSTNSILFEWLEPLLPVAVANLQAGQRLVELKRIR
jgi:predicted nuclease of predicted toxin-antitoxin system